MIYLTYEQLISNPQATVMRVITEMTGQEPDPGREPDRRQVRYERQTGGRAAGVEDRSSFIRKGVAGDWVNHFSRASAELSPTCRRRHHLLGYEEDPSGGKIALPRLNEVDTSPDTSN